MPETTLEEMNAAVAAAQAAFPAWRETSVSNRQRVMFRLRDLVEKHTVLTWFPPAPTASHTSLLRPLFALSLISPFSLSVPLLLSLSLCFSLSLSLSPPPPAHTLLLHLSRATVDHEV